MDQHLEVAAMAARLGVEKLLHGHDAPGVQVLALGAEFVRVLRIVGHVLGRL